MKTLMPVHPSLSLLYVVYPGRSPERATESAASFYVWSKHNLHFCGGRRVRRGQ